MGQYYRGVILNEEKTEVINALCCYAHGNGAKLMEHSYIGNHYVRAYEHLLSTTFKNKPFVWCGDYADTDWYGKAIDFDDSRTKDMYERKYNCAYPTNRTETKHHLTIPHRKWRYNKYLINYDKAQYVKLPKCKKGVWQIHPLPLLCADGNGRGGGDYSGINENMVGIWAYDHIGIANELLTDKYYTEMKVEFKEIW